MSLPFLCTFLSIIVDIGDYVGLKSRKVNSSIYDKVKPDPCPHDLGIIVVVGFQEQKDKRVIQVRRPRSGRPRK